MLNKNQSRTQAKNGIQVAVINDNRFAVEKRNGNLSFNLTQMSKPFGRSKSPGRWLRTDAAREYLEAFAVSQKSLTADLLQVRQGGAPERQGTWANDYRIAAKYWRRQGIEVRLLNFAL